MFRALIVARSKEYANNIFQLIDWNQNGFSNVICVAETSQAYIEISVNSPNLIIIDAQSPCMYQMEFLFRVSQTLPYCKTILITGSKDFDIAQAAFDFHVNALLLWSELTSDILLRRVKRIHKELDESIHQRGIVKRQLFRDILKGKIPTQSEIAQYFEIYDPSPRFVIIRINRDSPYRIFSDESYPPIGYYAINWHGSKIPEEFSYIATVNVSMHSWCTLLQIKKIISASQIRFLTRSAAIALQNSFRQQVQDTVSLTFSRPVLDLSEVPAVVNKLEKALALQRYFGREQVHSPEDFPVVSPTNTLLLHTLVDQFNSAMQNNAKEDALQCILSIFRNLKQNMVDPSAIRIACDSILDCIQNYCSSKCLPQDSLQQMRAKAVCYSTDDIGVWFCHAVSALMSNEQLISYSGASQKVQTIINFIQKNYGRDLTVTSLAAQLHISSDYLRHLFKEETGENLTSFISRVKIENAKAFLQSGQYKVNEVAQMVGFNTTQYFSTVFRKQVGCTPKEYIARQLSSSSSEPALKFTNHPF